MRLPAVGLLRSSKQSGLAGSRLGWALVKDPIVAAFMRQVIAAYNGIGIDPQIRALAAMLHVTASPEQPLPELYRFGRDLQAERWDRLLALFDAGASPFRVLNRVDKYAGSFFPSARSLVSVTLTFRMATALGEIEHDRRLQGRLRVAGRAGRLRLRRALPRRRRPWRSGRQLWRHRAEPADQHDRAQRRHGRAVRRRVSAALRRARERDGLLAFVVAVLSSDPRS